MNLLDKWQQALAAHPNLDRFSHMNHATKIAILCQTMTMVVGVPKATKEEPFGWNFFFKVTEQRDETGKEIAPAVIEVFSQSHKLLRTYLDYDFTKPILTGTPAQEKAIDNLLSSMQFKV